jgi:hypothetical protein
MGVHLGSIGLHFLHYIPFVIVFHIWTHFLSLMGLCIPHLVANPSLELQQMLKNTNRT